MQEITFGSEKFYVTEMLPLDHWGTVVQIGDWISQRPEWEDKEWKIRRLLMAASAAAKAGLDIFDLACVGVTMRFRDGSDYPDGNDFATVFLFKQNHRGTTYAVE